MIQLTALALFIQAHWVAITAAVALVVKGLQLLVTILLSIPALEQSKLLIEIEAGLAALIVHLPTSDMRAKLRRPVPPARPDKPETMVKGKETVQSALDPHKTPPGGVKFKRLAFLSLWVLALLFTPPARAQYVSVGASLPMLEFQGGNQHPVQFAPGAGGMLSVGFLQTGFLGQQWDLLDFSASLFGSALSTPTGAPAGALQAALEIGTLNNIFAIGAAVPLYGPDNIGAFQGSFKVFPLLTLNLPISLAPDAPPTTVENGPAGLPRGGTMYLLAPKPATPEPAPPEGPRENPNPGH